VKRLAYTDNTDETSELEREHNLSLARGLLSRLGASARCVEPGSAAALHAAATGHQLASGCCRNSPANRRYTGEAT
jgi:hypothetical protein